MKKRLSNKGGFTLIELIVVIAVIAILAAVLIPRFAGFTRDARESGMRSSARNALVAMEALVATGDISNSTADTAVDTAVDDYVGRDLGTISAFAVDDDGDATTTTDDEGIYFTLTDGDGNKIVVEASNIDAAVITLAA